MSRFLRPPLSVWLLALSVGLAFIARPAGLPTNNAVHFLAFGAPGFRGGVPNAPLLFARDGRLYGTTTQSGHLGFSLIYGVNPDGTGYQILHEFPGANDGPLWKLLGGLAEGEGGALYGAAESLNRAEPGVLFRVDAEVGSYAVLHRFRAQKDTDLSRPTTPLIFAPDGMLYGAAAPLSSQSSGSFFRLNVDGTGYTNLAYISRSPSPLLRAPDGTFYGIATDYRTCFRLLSHTNFFQPAWPNETFHFFSEDNLSDLSSGLLLGRDGVLYGTAAGGKGTDSGGVVYRLRQDGTGFTVLHRFSGDPSSGELQPRGRLVQGSDGALYGTTAPRSATLWACVFRIEPDGTDYSLVHVFKDWRTGAPRGPLELSLGRDGFLYGMTTLGGHTNATQRSGLGTLFKIALPQAITQIKQGPLGLRLHLTGQAGKTYRLEGSSSLLVSDWQPLGTATADDAGQFQFADPKPADVPAWFYRAVVP